MSPFLRFLLLIGTTTVSALSIPPNSTISSSSLPVATNSYVPTENVIFEMSSDSEMSFYIDEALSLSATHGSSTGELLRIATNLLPGNFPSFYNAFNTMAQRISHLAQSTNPTTDPVGAREAYFRAATYYRGADFLLHHNQSDPRIPTVWKNALSTFNKANALLPVPGVRFEVPAHGETIGAFKAIGIFFAAQGHDVKEERKKKLPTIIVGTGYDGSQEELYHASCVEILARGMNCVTYEGPGQPSVLREQHKGFIPDWWNVVTPVVDHVLGRDDVDAERLVLVGVSYGGQLAPVAVSREHRFSAVVLIDGAVDLQKVTLGQFPGKIRELYAAGAENATAREEFDEILLETAANTTTPSNARWAIDQGLFAWVTHSPYQWMSEWGQAAFTKEMAGSIKPGLPIAVYKGQNDTLTGNDAVACYNMLVEDREDGRSLTYYHEFPNSLGAGLHVQLGAEAELWRVTMAWLSEVWGGYRFSNN